MVNKYKPIRSNTAGAQPAAAQLAEGQLAINTNDRAIYSKTPAGAVVALTRTLSEVWTYIQTQILPVASGGTGTNTFPAGSILVGNGTSPIASTLPSTATYVIKGNIVSGSLVWTQDYALTYWTEGLGQVAPNATVPVSYLTPRTTTTDADAAIIPKGAGALIAQIPDSAATGGNKRGTYAVDHQRTRTSATQVATGSYSAIVQGSNNTASSLNSVILNGVTNAATTGTYATVLNGTTHTASGTSSLIGNGTSNTASGVNATVVNGSSNNASANNAQILNGTNNTASGVLSSVINATNSTASGRQSTVLSGSYVNTKGIEGGILYANTGNTVLGQSQSGVYSMAVSTTGAVAGCLTTNKTAASTTNQLILANNSVIVFNALIGCIDTVNSYAAGFWLQGVALRLGTAASTVVVSNLLTQIANNFPLLNTVTCSAAADTTNGGIALNVTGQSGLTINWTATVNIAEVTR